LIAIVLIHLFKTNDMKLSQILLIAALLLLAAPAARAEKRHKLKITAATVYLNGASLTSTASVDLIKGENEILFTNVASYLNAAGILVNATNGVVVEATNFNNDYLAPEVPSPRIKLYADSIETLEDSKSFIRTKITTLNEQITILQANREVRSDAKGLSVAELGKMLDLVGSKLGNYIDEKNRQERLLKNADVRIEQLRVEMAAERNKGLVVGGKLLIKFYTEAPVKTEITVTYTLPNAGWTPVYDIMADAANAPVKLFYKASVYQNSGLSWDNIKLSLSTGNPAEGVQAPVMSPWYIALYVPAVAQMQQSAYAVRAYKKPLVSQDRAGQTVLTSEDIGVLPTTEISDMVGLAPALYQSQRGKGVNIGGARSSGSLYVIDGVQVQNIGSIDQYTSVNDIGVNAVFDIDLPYTIQSENKRQLVAIKKYEMPATYRYYAAPKLDKDVFLQAQVTGWEDKNLLPGETNIFYEGVYIGAGVLDIRHAMDTLLISLGRDKKVIVSRDRDKKERSVKTIGTNVRETFAYTITARNTRKEPIDLVILDQVPVSNDNAVVVEDIDKPESEFNEKTGFVTWKFSVKPAQTKKIGLGFAVKYPKGKSLAGL
jgi:hypothetical protein